MANQITDYGQKYWSGVLFGLNAVPSSYWIALATAEPGRSSNGTILAAQTEVQAADYKRIQVLSNSSNWLVDASGYLVNIAQIFIGVTTSDWGLVQYFCLTDALTNGNLYAYSLVANPAHVELGAALVIPAGSIVIQTGSVQPTIAG